MPFYLFGCSQNNSTSQNEVDLDAETTEIPIDDTSNEDSPDTGEDDSEEFDCNNSTTEEELEIIGSYIDNYSSEHVITQNGWLIDYGSLEEYYYIITQFSNTDTFLVAENDNSNGIPEAGAWSRFDWTYDQNDALWVCQTTNIAENQEAALATEKPDNSNPSSTGCEPYGWLKLGQ